MTGPHYSLVNTIVQRISSTSLVSGFFARYLHSMDSLLLKLSKGRMTLTSLLSGLPMIMLTTTGARSGLLRHTPLAWISDPAGSTQFAIIASNFGQAHHPGWYYNLKSDPHATVTIKGQVRQYLAHEATAEEYARYWQCALDIYPYYQQYQSRAGKRHIPIMVLVPEPS